MRSSTATGDIASARAALAATREIPVVFTVGSDPVPFGLVTSLSRPTGNATGITLFSSTLMAKSLEFLREVAPNVRLIALLMNPDKLNYDVDVKAAQEAARNLDRQTTIVHAKSPAVIDGAFETIVQRRAGAILVASDPKFLGQRDRLAALAAKYVSTHRSVDARVCELPVSCTAMERASRRCIGRRAYSRSHSEGVKAFRVSGRAADRGSSSWWSILRPPRCLVSLSRNR